MDELSSISNLLQPVTVASVSYTIEVTVTECIINDLIFEIEDVPTTYEIGSTLLLEIPTEVIQASESSFTGFCDFIINS